MLSSISSCGTLRIAPWKMAFDGRGPCLIAFLLVAAFPVGPPPHKLPKTVRFLKKYTKNLSTPWPGQFSNFWACGRYFSSFWLCAPSFPFILAFWAFILASRPPFWPLGLQFWHFGPSGGVSFGSSRLFGPSGGASFCSPRPFGPSEGVAFCALWPSQREGHRKQTI